MDKADGAVAGPPLRYYPAPDMARESWETARLAPVPSPEFDDNPDVAVVPADYPDHYRYSDTPDTRWARRGFIAWFLNPAQFWQADFTSGGFMAGKIITGQQSAAYMAHGMLPSPQRANIPLPVPTTYGDHIALSTSLEGVEPMAGWGM